MNLNEKVKDALEELKPRLDELADGYAELVEADEAKGVVKLSLIGGRLH
jgi:Fe-S cluster biogenesis protein NfuA